MKLRAATLAFLACAGCAAPRAPEGDPMTRPKQPYPTYVFEKGPALADAEALAAWLSTQRAAKKLVRLPVLLRRSDAGTGVGSAQVLGTEPPLAVRVADSALGIPLSDHFRRAAGDKDEASLLLIGYWAEPEDGVARFDLRKVEGVVPAGTTHAEVVTGER